MNSLEELKIYQYYVDLYFYTYNITCKYPKSEKAGLVSDIKNVTCQGLENIIAAQKEYNTTKRLEFLNAVDSKLKVLKVLVRISYRFKYINSKNYGAWSRKLATVANLLNGWIKQCQRQ